MKFWQLLSLTTAVVGSPVSSISDYTRMLKEKRSGSYSPTNTDLANFEYYSQHSGAAYCNFNTPAGQPVECSSGVCDEVHATVLQSFMGGLTGTGAYVSVDDSRKEIVFSTRGSNNIRNFITDILFQWTDCDFVDDCQVHSGFAAAWDDIADDVTNTINQAHEDHPDYKIIVTGHSLGGAIAILAGSYLRDDGLDVDVYTYGAPRVGNDHYANFVNSQPGKEFRITHTTDPIPRLPPIIFGYRHISPEFWLATGNDATVNYNIHDIRICDGIANIGCNGGTFGLDIIAHLHYLRSITGCSGFPLLFKRDDTSSNATTEGISQDVIDRLNKWSQADQSFVKSLAKRDTDVSEEELMARFKEWSEKDKGLVNAQ